MQEEIKQLRELLAAGGDIPPEMLAKLGGGGRKTKKKEQKIKRGPRVSHVTGPPALISTRAGVQQFV